MARSNRQPSEVLLADLRARLEALAVRRGSAEPSVISSGHQPLDALLPGGGFRRGTLVEWLVEQPGAGASTLALGAARECCAAGGALVVVDGAGEFHPPGAVALGLALEELLLVRTASPDDEHWAIDQALRSPGVAAVVAWPERCGPKAVRRWQLAAERGGSLGLLVRPARVRDEPCWAAVRLAVATVPVVLPPGRAASSVGRRLRVEWVRGSGVVAGKTIEWELGHETSTVSRLSVPRASRRA